MLVTLDSGRGTSPSRVTAKQRHLILARSLLSRRKRSRYEPSISQLSSLRASRLSPRLHHVNALTPAPQQRRVVSVSFAG